MIHEKATEVSASRAGLAEREGGKMEATRKSDAEIQDRVSCELRADPLVEARDVRVAVIEGVVMLTGVAPSWAKRVAAKEAADRVVGVREVVNSLQVQWVSHVPHSALVHGVARAKAGAERPD